MKNIETVEEFLQRGGKIQTIPYEKRWRDLKEMQKVTEEELKKFYNSSEWKSVRDEVYKTLTHFCPVCGSEKDLVVDHINPVRYFWDQRLDKDNLQILCNDCNLEKKSELNWSLEWHIKNKDILSKERKYQQKKRNPVVILEENYRKKLKRNDKKSLSKKSYPEKFLKK